MSIFITTCDNLKEIDMSKKLATASILIAGIMFAAPAFSSTSAHLPAEHKAGPVTYMSGGVGTDEANAMKAAEHRYNLVLEFVQKARPRDEYLADIGVEVKDHSGKMLLNVDSNGPFLLSRMPAGKYTIVASNDGRILTKTAEVSSRHHSRLVFVWPAQAREK
jgi:hypothetical protein